MDGGQHERDYQKDYFLTIIKQYENQNAQFREKQCHLRHRLEAIECSMPALMCFNMIQGRTKQPENTEYDSDPVKDQPSSSCQNDNQEFKNTRNDSNLRSCDCNHCPLNDFQLGQKNPKITNAPTVNIRNDINMRSCKCNPCPLSEDTRNINSPIQNAFTSTPSNTSYQQNNKPKLPYENTTIPNDVLYITKIKGLVEDERKLKDDVEELEHRQRIYTETLKQTQERSNNEIGCNGEGDFEIQALKRMNQELEANNRTLEEELEEVKREIKYIQESVEEPMRRGLENERRKYIELEEKVNKRGAEISNRESAHRKKVIFLEKQLHSVSRNLNDLHVINKRLKEELCMLNCRYNELQTDLINQKLSEIHTISRMTAAKDTETYQPPLPKPVLSLSGVSSGEDLNNIARNLSKLLQEATACSNCKIAHPDLIDTVQYIKDLVEIVNKDKKVPAKSDKKSLPDVVCKCVDLKKLRAEMVAEDSGEPTHEILSPKKFLSEESTSAAITKENILETRLSVSEKRPSRKVSSGLAAATDIQNILIGNLVSEEIILEKRSALIENASKEVSREETDQEDTLESDAPTDTEDTAAVSDVTLSASVTEGIVTDSEPPTETTQFESDIEERVGLPEEEIAAEEGKDDGDLLEKQIIEELLSSVAPLPTLREQGKKFEDEIELDDEKRTQIDDAAAEIIGEEEEMFPEDTPKMEDTENIVENGPHDEAEILEKSKDILETTEEDIIVREDEEDIETTEEDMKVTEGDDGKEEVVASEIAEGADDEKEITDTKSSKEERMTSEDVEATGDEKDVTDAKPSTEKGMVSEDPERASDEKEIRETETAQLGDADIFESTMESGEIAEEETALKIKSEEAGTELKAATLEGEPDDKGTEEKDSVKSVPVTENETVADIVRTICRCIHRDEPQLCDCPTEEKESPKSNFKRSNDVIGGSPAGEIDEVVPQYGTEVDSAPDETDGGAPPDAIGDASPPDAIGDATPPDAVGNATLPDTVEDTAPPDAVGDAVPPDAVEDAAPPDAIGDAVSPDAIGYAAPSDVIGDAAPLDSIEDEALPDERASGTSPDETESEARPDKPETLQGVPSKTSTGSIKSPLGISSQDESDKPSRSPKQSKPVSKESSKKSLPQVENVESFEGNVTPSHVSAKEASIKSLDKQISPKASKPSSENIREQGIDKAFSDVPIRSPQRSTPISNEPSTKSLPLEGTKRMHESNSTPVEISKEVSEKSLPHDEISSVKGPLQEQVSKHYSETLTKSPPNSKPTSKEPSIKSISEDVITKHSSSAKSKEEIANSSANKSREKISSREPSVKIDQQVVTAESYLSRKDSLKASTAEIMPRSSSAKGDVEDSILSVKVEAEAEGNVPTETDVELITKSSDGLYVTTTVTSSGHVEVTTEGPTGVVETTLKVTESGNLEVVTGLTEYDKPDDDSAKETRSDHSKDDDIPEVEVIHGPVRDMKESQDALDEDQDSHKSHGSTTSEVAETDMQSVDKCVGEEVKQLSDGVLGVITEEEEITEQREKQFVEAECQYEESTPDKIEQQLPSGMRYCQCPPPLVICKCDEDDYESQEQIEDRILEDVEQDPADVKSLDKTKAIDDAVPTSNIQSEDFIHSCDESNTKKSAEPSTERIKSVEIMTEVLSLEQCYTKTSDEIEYEEVMSGSTVSDVSLFDDIKSEQNHQSKKQTSESSHTRSLTIDKPYPHESDERVLHKPTESAKLDRASKSILKHTESNYEAIANATVSPNQSANVPIGVLNISPNIIKLENVEATTSTSDLKFNSCTCEKQGTPKEEDKQRVPNEEDNKIPKSPEEENKIPKPSEDEQDAPKVEDKQRVPNEEQKMSFVTCTCEKQETSKVKYKQKVPNEKDNTISESSEEENKIPESPEEEQGAPNEKKSETAQKHKGKQIPLKNEKPDNTESSPKTKPEDRFANTTVNNLKIIICNRDICKTHATDEESDADIPKCECAKENRQLHKICNKKTCSTSSKSRQDKKDKSSENVSSNKLLLENATCTTCDKTSCQVIKSRTQYVSSESVFEDEPYVYPDTCSSVGVQHTSKNLGFLCPKSCDDIRNPENETKTNPRSVCASSCTGLDYQKVCPPSCKEKGVQETSRSKRSLKSHFTNTPKSSKICKIDICDSRASEQRTVSTYYSCNPIEKAVCSPSKCNQRFSSMKSQTAMDSKTDNHSRMPQKENSICDPSACKKGVSSKLRSNHPSEPQITRICNTKTCKTDAYTDYKSDTMEARKSIIKQSAPDQLQSSEECKCKNPTQKSDAKTETIKQPISNTVVDGKSDSIMETACTSLTCSMLKDDRSSKSQNLSRKLSEPNTCSSATCSALNNYQSVKSQTPTDILSETIPCSSATCSGLRVDSSVKSQTPSNILSETIPCSSATCSGLRVDNSAKSQTPSNILSETIPCSSATCLGLRVDQSVKSQPPSDKSRSTNQQEESRCTSATCLGRILDIPTRQLPDPKIEKKTDENKSSSIKSGQAEILGKYFAVPNKSSSTSSDQGLSGHGSTIQDISQNSSKPSFASSKKSHSRSSRTDKQPSATASSTKSDAISPSIKKPVSLEGSKKSNLSAPNTTASSTKSDTISPSITKPSSPEGSKKSNLNSPSTTASSTKSDAISPSIKRPVSSEGSKKSNLSSPSTKKSDMAEPSDRVGFEIEDNRSQEISERSSHPYRPTEESDGKVDGVISQKPSAKLSGGSVEDKRSHIKYRSQNLDKPSIEPVTVENLEKEVRTWDQIDKPISSEVSSKSEERTHKMSPSFVGTRDSLGKDSNMKTSKVQQNLPQDDIRISSESDRRTSEITNMQISSKIAKPETNPVTPEIVKSQKLSTADVSESPKSASRYTLTEKLPSVSDHKEKTRRPSQSIDQNKVMEAKDVPLSKRSNEYEEDTSSSKMQSTASENQILKDKEIQDSARSRTIPSEKYSGFTQGEAKSSDRVSKRSSSQESHKVDKTASRTSQGSTAKSSEISVTNLEQKSSEKMPAQKRISKSSVKSSESSICQPCGKVQGTASGDMSKEVKKPPDKGSKSSIHSTDSDKRSKSKIPIPVSQAPSQIKGKHQGDCACMECLTQVKQKGGHPPDCDCVDCLCQPSKFEKRMPKIEEGEKEGESLQHSLSCTCIDCLCQPTGVKKHIEKLPVVIEDKLAHSSSCLCVDCLCAPSDEQRKQKVSTHTEGSMDETPKQQIDKPMETPKQLVYTCPSLAPTKLHHPDCECPKCICDPCSKLPDCSCKLCRCNPCTDEIVKFKKHPPDCTCPDCLCAPCGDRKVEESKEHPPRCNCADCICEPCNDKEVQERKERLKHTPDCNCTDCVCQPCADPKVLNKKEVLTQHPKDCDCPECSSQPCNDEEAEAKKSEKHVEDGDCTCEECVCDPCDDPKVVRAKRTCDQCECLICVCNPCDDPAIVARKKPHPPSCNCPECTCDPCNDPTKSKAHGPGCRCTKCVCQPCKSDGQDHGPDCKCPTCVCETCTDPLKKKSVHCPDCKCHKCVCQPCKSDAKEHGPNCNCPTCSCNPCLDATKKRSLHGLDCVCPRCECDKKEAVPIESHSPNWRCSVCKHMMPKEVQKPKLVIPKKPLHGPKCPCEKCKPGDKIEQPLKAHSANCKCSVCKRKIPKETPKSNCIDPPEQHSPNCKCSDCKLGRSNPKETSKTKPIVRLTDLADILEECPECDCSPICMCDDCPAKKNDTAPVPEKMNDDALKKNIKNIAKENVRREKDIKEIEKLMKQIRCSCKDAEKQAALASPPEAVLIQRTVSFKNTLSGLQIAMNTLEDKCRVKDKMINAMTQELRLRADSNIFNDMFRNMASLPPIDVDFDMHEICDSLPRPANDPRYGRPSYRYAEEEFANAICCCESGSLSLKIIDVKQISPNSILVKWTQLASHQVIGYEVMVENILKSRIHSGQRTSAVVFAIAMKSKLNISVYALTQFGRCEPPATCVYG